LLEVAVKLLPEIAPRQLARVDQQLALGNANGLASMAAASVLANPNDNDTEPTNAGKALQLLELGRAVLLSQALEIRTDLTDLKDVAPEMADAYDRLRNALNKQPASRTGTRTVGESIGVTRPVEVPPDRTVLYRQFNAVVEEIRQIDGFAGFMMSPSLEELTRQAVHGPIVVYNINGIRCDALILRTTGVTSHPLNELKIVELIDHINSFYHALHVVTCDRDLIHRVNAEMAIHDTLAWLWRVAVEPVLEELGFNESPIAGAPWPRIWWAPGGLLGLLPLHAAGDHLAPSVDMGRPTVMDRVISSYTPTVRALRYARERTSTRPAESALVVAMPTTPGLGDLGHVIDEARMVERSFARSYRTADGTATSTLVMEKIGHCDVVHFACHGVSDRVDPSRSRLFLGDHEQNPLTVAKLGSANLTEVQLAYLSACETASSTITELLDESIDLVSAFQLAGYPHVIGTLWPVSDALSVTVAKMFYSGLKAGGCSCDASLAAGALHFAIRHIRDNLKLIKSPSLWASYLHAGA